MLGTLSKSNEKENVWLLFHSSYFAGLEKGSSICGNIRAFVDLQILPGPGVCIWQRKIFCHFTDAFFCCKICYIQNIKHYVQGIRSASKCSRFLISQIVKFFALSDYWLGLKW